MSEEHEDMKAEPAPDALAHCAEEKPADLVVASKLAFKDSLRSLQLHEPRAVSSIPKLMLVFAETIEDVLAEGCTATRRFVEVNVGVSRSAAKTRWTVVVEVSLDSLMSAGRTSLRLCYVEAADGVFPAEVVPLDGEDGDSPAAAEAPRMVADDAELQAALEHVTRTSDKFRERLEDTLRLVSDISM